MNSEDSGISVTKLMHDYFCSCVQYGFYDKIIYKYILNENISYTNNSGNTKNYNKNLEKKCLSNTFPNTNSIVYRSNLISSAISNIASRGI